MEQRVDGWETRGLLLRQYREQGLQQFRKRSHVETPPRALCQRAWQGPGQGLLNSVAPWEEWLWAPWPILGLGRLDKMGGVREPGPTEGFPHTKVNRYSGLDLR